MSEFDLLQLDGVERGEQFFEVIESLIERDRYLLLLGVVSDVDDIVDHDQSNTLTLLLGLEGVYVEIDLLLRVVDDDAE